MNKVILITGASSGIGEGIARELGKAGAKVFLGARRLERIHALADEIRSAGGEAEAQVLDVTSRQSMAAFVEAAREKWGRIDVLINNAGIMPLSPLSAGKQDEWERGIARELGKAGAKVFLGARSWSASTPWLMKSAAQEERQRLRY